MSTDDTFVSMRYHNIGKRWWDYVETKQIAMVSDMLPPTFSLKSSPIDSLSRLHQTRQPLCYLCTLSVWLLHAEDFKEQVIFDKLILIK